jgi:hypothetical protein
MIIANRQLLMFLLAGLIGGCADTVSRDRDDVVLVRATLESSDFLHEPTTEFRDDKMIVRAAPEMITFRVNGVLIGHISQVRITVTEFGTHDPMPGLAYFLIATRDAGALTAKWWDLADHGLCLDEVKKKFDIEQEVAALQKFYPCAERNHQGGP